MMLKLDHLAVAAETLEAGRAYVEEALGVDLLPGGQHPHYGTHNRLLGLADGLYLEVIAVDPEATAPGYPRWFDLDRFSGRPRLSNWICQTEDLAAFTKAVPEAGQIVPLQRGELRWSMAVPPTGILPFDNLFPPVIEWASHDHPSQRLPGSGCALKMLTLTHPEAQALQARLAAYFDDPRVRFETGPVGMIAELATPLGARILE